MSDKDEIVFMASLCYWSFTFLLGRSLRHIITKRFSSRYMSYGLDFVTTFQQCSVSFENGIISKFYGFHAYLFCLFMVGILYSLTLGNSSGNPCGIWQQYIEKKLSFQNMCTKVLVQIMGGLLAYPYVFAWRCLGLCHEHVVRNLMRDCSSDLHVSLLAGFLIEMLATAIDISSSLIIFSKLFRYRRLQQLAQVLLGVTLTAHGVHLTGMYTNPVKASAMTLGCSGTGLGQHMFVYWVAPFLGVVIAVHVCRWYAQWMCSDRRRGLISWLKINPTAMRAGKILSISSTLITSLEAVANFLDRTERRDTSKVE